MKLQAITAHSEPLTAAVLLLLGHGLRVQVDRRLSGRARLGVLGHLRLDLASHRKERLLDVGQRQRRGFKEGDVECIGKLLRSGVLDNLFVSQVGLVADQQLHHPTSSVAVNLLQPLLDVVEQLLVSDVVYNDDAVSATVVGGSNGTEPLLASGIPDLQLDGLTIQLDRTDLEVNTDGQNVVRSVRVVGEPEQQGRLANTGVTDQQ